MARFYFNVDDGKELAIDDLGVELADLAAARKEAAIFAGEMLKDGPDDFWDVQGWRMAITDAAGLTLFTIEVGGKVAPAVTSAERRTQRAGASARRA
jgi:hypothetical protein